MSLDDREGLEAINAAPEGRAEPWEQASDGSTDQDDVRLAVLNDAIDLYPEAAMNYVLRGELLLKSGRIEQSIRDLERALALAQRAFETNNWGVVAQVVQDRAQRGLERAQRSFAASQSYLYSDNEIED
jgi:tetratricopeptide (TPR) repeat protein